MYQCLFTCVSFQFSAIKFHFSSIKFADKLINLSYSTTGLTVIVTDWITQSEKNVNSANRDQRSRCIDSLLNFETVKYCGTEDYEVESFSQATTKCQKEERKSGIPYVLLDSIQDIIIHGTLLAGSLFCAYLVVDVDSITTGQYIFFVSHIGQLYYPLNQLIYFYS